MNRLVVGITGPLLALGLLTACNDDAGAIDEAASPSVSVSPGDSPRSPESPSTGHAPGDGTKYCDLLGVDLATLFANIKGPEDAAAAVDVMKKVAAEAPPEIQGDWRVLSAALDQMGSALTKAADLEQQAKAGKISAKKSQTQLAAILRQTQALSTPRTNAAGRAVAAHAGDYCGIKLGG